MSRKTKNTAVEMTPATEKNNGTNNNNVPNKKENATNKVANITEDNVSTIVQHIEVFTAKPNSILMTVSYYIFDIEKEGECDIILKLPSNFYSVYIKECDRYNRGDESGDILRNAYIKQILSEIRKTERNKQ